MNEHAHETATHDAISILKTLHENGRDGRSNRLADVKSTLESKVANEFDRYFFFLRKFHYIAMDREAQLKLTESGQLLLDAVSDKFRGEVEDFFADSVESAEELLVGVDEESTDRHPLGRFTTAADARTAPTVPQVAPLAAAASRSHGSTARKDAAAHASASGTFSTFSGAPALSGAEPTGSSTERWVRGESVGQGPLGNVYHARMGSLGVEVALKEIKDLPAYFSFLQRAEVAKRLRKELCAQAQVHHPSVVRLLDQSTDSIRPYFVTELLHESLRDVLARRAEKPVAPKQAIQWFLQLVHGLRAAHHVGLTHHNLKPENVLFDAYGNAKLSDFGMTRIIESEAGMPQVLLATGGVPYMAPELLQPQKDRAGPGADVYALGVLLYEMLTGLIPGRRSPMPSEANPDVPDKVDALFDRMTQDRKDARPTDMDAVLEDFHAAFKDHEYAERDELVLRSPKLSAPHDESN